MPIAIEQVEAHESFGGVQGIYRHSSTVTGCTMTFSVFVPAQASAQARPVVTYLSGLSCTHANVTEKGDYRRAAAEAGLIVVCPDTSPRGQGVADDESYDLGQGAGFYVDATRQPWSSHYRMESYIAEELPELIAAEFPVDVSRQGIFGHSMGGHGALTLALRHPGLWRSVSAFAPIASPALAPWGRKAFSAYLGPQLSAWQDYDAVYLLRAGRRCPPILVDIGQADPFLERELRPNLLLAACDGQGQPLLLRRHPRYDHSYFFISTFMADHIRWHADHLSK